MIHGCRWLAYSAAVICVYLTIGSLLETDMKPNPTPAVFREPANWKYAAAREGHTFHARGCPGVPKLPAREMVYGSSVAEMFRAYDKQPCPLCITIGETPPE